MSNENIFSVHVENVNRFKRNLVDQFASVLNKSDVDIIILLDINFNRYKTFQDMVANHQKYFGIYNNQTSDEQRGLSIFVKKK